MTQPVWQSILLSNPDHQEAVWELFHENSKNTRYEKSLSEQEITEQINQLHESLPFEGYPIIDLPTAVEPLHCRLSEAIISRTSTLNMVPRTLSLINLVSLLHYAYGTTHRMVGVTSSRPFRAVPSAGALHPLEIFFYSGHLQDLPRGLYHYNPSKNHLRLLVNDLELTKVAEGFIQSNVAFNASLILFITAIFERSVFKYGERGYRYTLLEAGHVAQNVYLVSNALGLACLSIGGFLDRYVDNLLGLDGLRYSTVYVLALGGRAESGALE